MQSYLRGKDECDIAVETPLQLNSEFEDREFDLYYFSKKDLKENDVKEVRCKGNNGDRIGLMIPVLALDSDDHDFSDKKYFLQYAYIAIRDGLKNIDQEIFYNPISENLDSVRLTEILHTETAILVISRETFKGGYQFNIDNSIPSLLSYGYVKLGKTSPDHLKFKHNSTDKKIIINPTSDDVEYSGLISDLLTNSFPYETREASRFFYIYQVFELLIERIYQFEHDKLFGKLIESRGDLYQVKEILREINNISSEKARMRLLTSKYVSIERELQDLKVSCNDLLPLLGKESSSSFSDYFYQIRNFIFHQYRNFPTEAEEKLADVVASTVSIIPSFLSNFRNPYAVRAETGVIKSVLVPITQNAPSIDPTHR